MLALSYPNEASLCATALTWTPNTAEQLFKRSGRDYARSSKKSRNSRGALERKSTGSANWKSSHHQSFRRLSLGTSVAVEPLWTAQPARPNMDEQCHRGSAARQKFWMSTVRLNPN